MAGQAPCCPRAANRSQQDNYRPKFDISANAVNRRTAEVAKNQGESAPSGCHNGKSLARILRYCVASHDSTRDVTKVIRPLNCSARCASCPTEVSDRTCQRRMQCGPGSGRADRVEEFRHFELEAIALARARSRRSDRRGQGREARWRNSVGQLRQIQRI